MRKKYSHKWKKKTVENFAACFDIFGDLIIDIYHTKR